MDVSILLRLSALGIYVHSVFVSITLGFPIAIMALLYKFYRTQDDFYFRAAKKMTVILAINFALGAVTGTLVEFGLVQAWPGTIFAIASFVFAPLALELIAFANEVALLVLFIATLGKIRPMFSFAIILVYWIFAAISGVFITTVNSWLGVPWGTGVVAHTFYPFIPVFGPQLLDVQKILILKILLLATNQPLQSIIQNPEVSSKIGVILADPLIALNHPYAFWSNVHNVVAGFIVGLSIALVAWTHRYRKTGDARYLSIVKSFLPMLLVMLLLQPTIFGHFMGEQVVNYNPTKFAMMENARHTYNDPIMATIVYGDPLHPIIGFDEFYRKCNLHGDKTIGELAKEVGIDENEILSVSKAIGVEINNKRLKEVLETKLKDVCFTDVKRAEEKIPIVHALYYTKLSGGVLAFLSVILSTLVVYFPANRLSKKLNNKLFIFALLIFLSSTIAATFGWAVREIGRKPWTIYGLLWPEEIVSINTVALSSPFVYFLSAIILVVGFGGLFAMYIVATRYEG